MVAPTGGCVGRGGVKRSRPGSRSPSPSPSSSSTSHQQRMGSPAPAQGLRSNPPPPCTLELEYWVRVPECKRLKDDHIEYIDGHYSSRENFIVDTVFTHPMTGELSEVVLEPNMFPYECPPDVEHWTLWSMCDMDHDEVVDWVTQYIQRHMPHVVAWNYDDNAGDRSIQWFHVHVYFQYSDKKYVRRAQAAAQSSEDWGSYDSFATASAAGYSTSAAASSPSCPSSPVSPQSMPMPTSRFDCCTSEKGRSRPYASTFSDISSSCGGTASFAGYTTAASSRSQSMSAGRSAQRDGRNRRSRSPAVSPDPCRSRRRSDWSGWLCMMNWEKNAKFPATTATAAG